MLKKHTVLATVFDEYRVERQIKQGGNGTVFLVKNSYDDEFAVKAIDRAKTSRDKLKRFKNELTFCQNNTHPNIVQVIDHGALKQGETDVVFYVMPYYPYTLRTKMNENSSPEERLNMFIQLMNALEFAHDKTVWHRDIKPENILMDRNGVVVLADFGIAHFCDEQLITAVETKATDRLANFQYSAPEQRVRGNTADGRSDIYAAGLILNELFTGKIISGSAYTKIADTHADWGYLDTLIDEMIVQNPAQRLFPVESVLFRLEVLDTEHKAQVELARLSAYKPENETSFMPLTAPQAIGADYNGGQLIIRLDQNMPREWCEMLRNGEYGHTASGNYQTQRFSSKGDADFAVPVRDYDERLIPDIINYFKTWLAPVTAMYNQKMKNQYEQQASQRAQQKQAEITKAQAELRIKQSLQSLF